MSALAGAPTLEDERAWRAHGAHRLTFEAEWAAERVRKSVQQSTWLESEVQWSLGVGEGRGGWR